jgi:EmrB/QacA subfamily drug resistance transporter
VAAGLFMTQVDATVLSTAIPVMAVDFAIDPVHLKLALTSYLLAIAIFIPASGWIADRLGARNVFATAMAVFALGSIACALSQNLGEIVAARVLQGVGGAMMVPVGRLVVLRTIPRSQVVGAFAMLAMPAMVGPILGPPVGGFLATYATWHWIFWINVPFAAAAIVLALRYIPDVSEVGSVSFDWLGFALVGPGLCALLAGFSVIGMNLLSGWQIAATIGIGALLLAAYVMHASRTLNALIDLRLLSNLPFRCGVTGGFLFRLGVGASAFLLPLLLQVGLGYTAFQSGLVTFASGIGAFLMKAIAPRILRSYGFRRVLVANAFIAAALSALPAFFALGLPIVVMLLVLLALGFSRSLQFTSSNLVLYADMPEASLSRATTFQSVLQELSISVGIAAAALALHGAILISGEDALVAWHFVPAFLIFALLSLASVAPLSALPSDVGRGLTGAGSDEVMEPSGAVAPAASGPTRQH